MTTQKLTEIIIEKYFQNRILDPTFFLSSQSKNIKVHKIKKIGGSINSVYSFTLLYSIKKKNIKINYILKLFNPSEIQRKICRREYGVLIFLKKRDFQVPIVHVMETDESFLGGPFMVMEQIEGKSIASYLKYNEKQINEILNKLAKMFVILHTIELNDVELNFLSVPETEYSYAKKSSLLKSSLNYAKNWDYSWVTNWLKTNVKNCPCAKYSLLHFDSNLKNFIISKQGTVFMVDWEWAEIGDAIRDVACVYHETSHTLGVKAALLFLDYYKKYSERQVTVTKLDFYLVVAGFNLALYNRLLSTRNGGTEFLINLFGKKTSPLFPLMRWHFNRKNKKLEENIKNIIFK